VQPRSRHRSSSDIPEQNEVIDGDPAFTTGMEAGAVRSALYERRRTRTGAATAQTVSYHVYALNIVSTAVGG
jgi:hypothetical protein